MTLTGLQSQMTEDLHLVQLSLFVLTWWSRRQKVVSRSIQTLLQELAVPHSTPVMLCDSSVVQLAHNPVLHARTKHMELDAFFVREKVLTKQLVVQHITGTAPLSFRGGGRWP